ncbi:MAG: exodeoxyribonuclease VII small subunit [Halioglobus sp.]
MAKSTKLTLEETLIQLRSTVDKLENESTSLQESLNAFEHGIKLTHQAQKTLLEAEQRVKVLLAEGEENQSSEFDQADTE